jgi:hypothetical protein
MWPGWVERMGCQGQPLKPPAPTRRFSEHHADAAATPAAPTADADADPGADTRIAAGARSPQILGLASSSTGKRYSASPIRPSLVAMMRPLAVMSRPGPEVRGLQIAGTTDDEATERIIVAPRPTAAVQRKRQHFQFGGVLQIAAADQRAAPGDGLADGVLAFGGNGGRQAALADGLAATVRGAGASGQEQQRESGDGEGAHGVVGSVSVAWGWSTGCLVRRSIVARVIAEEHSADLGYKLSPASSAQDRDRTDSQRIFDPDTDPDTDPDQERKPSSNFRNAALASPGAVPGSEAWSVPGTIPGPYP